MFGVALYLKVDDFKRIFKHPETVATGLFSQLIVLPIYTLLLLAIWKPAPSVGLGLCLVAACPGGSVSNYAVHIAKGDVALSVTLTSIVTCTSVLITPLLFSILGRVFPEVSGLLTSIDVSFWDLAQTIAMLLVIPLSLGMFIRYHFDKLAEKASKVIGPLSLLIFLAFIVGAVWKDRQNLVDHVMLVFWIVVIHNIGAMIIGYRVAKLFKRNESACKAIAIETGIQNSALGLVIIFNFFTHLGGMMLVAAWWGIWDLISSGALASFWGFKAQNSNE